MSAKVTGEGSTGGANAPERLPDWIEEVVNADVTRQRPNVGARDFLPKQGSDLLRR